MSHNLQFYIDGQWVAPVIDKRLGVVNPSTEEVFTEIAVGSKADVDKAVSAARRAFTSYSQTTRQQRLDLLQSITASFVKRWDDLALAISSEMGAPPNLSKDEQVWIGEAHLKKMIEVLTDYEFEYRNGKHLDHTRTRRRCRPHHTLELAPEPDHQQGLPGTRSRLHHGAEAQRSLTPQCHHIHRDHAWRGCASQACSTW